MRITIAHKKSKAEVIAAVDSAIAEAFRALAVSSVVIVEQQKVWTGSVMTFSVIAKIGFLKNTIKGTVEVTDNDVTIEADLGMLNHLAAGKEVRAAVESRVRRLLT
jgi:hypothetical protein